MTKRKAQSIQPKEFEMYQERAEEKKANQRYAQMTKAYELKNPQQIEEVRSRMLSAEKIRRYKIKKTPMREGESSGCSW